MSGSKMIRLFTYVASVLRSGLDSVVMTLNVITTITALVVSFTEIPLIAENLPIAPNLTVEVKMRDGKMLPIDLYYPPTVSSTVTPAKASTSESTSASTNAPTAPATVTATVSPALTPTASPKDFPCILLRSPAGRTNPFALQFVPLAQHGYVIAIQDTRSVVDEEGKTFPYFSDGWGSLQDGYDTVEWLAKSQYCNGKIGTLGVSALGITQLLMAPAAPPSLKCQYIGVAAGSLYHHAMYPGGRLLKHQVEGWLGLYAKDPSVLTYATDRQHYNDFWENFDTLKVSHRVEVPGVLYTGWYDTFLEGTIDSFIARNELGGNGARGQQKLIIGPWTHFWPQVKTIGDFDVPQAGSEFPIDLSPVRWFDYHLKNIPNGVDKVPPVSYYVMGPFDGTSSKGNVWKFADKWPVPSKETSYYLTKDKGLVAETKPKNECQFVYRHDPETCVPTVGGRNLFLESGAKDQSCIEKRDDILVFTSDILKEDLEVTGKVYVKLFFDSNHCDTDVSVRLTDVYPDGRSILIADGHHRIGHLEPHNGEINVDLWSTSMVFAKGHRIRISISSSNYPRYEKCGKGVAENIVKVGGVTPSALILPVVP